MAGGHGGGRENKLGIITAHVRNLEKRLKPLFYLSKKHQQYINADLSHSLPFSITKGCITNLIADSSV